MKRVAMILYEKIGICSLYVRNNQTEIVDSKILP